MQTTTANNKFILDPLLSEFMGEQTNVNLATSLNNIPHCATCMYAYSPDDISITFKSSEKTTHIQNILQNNIVAGSILPDKFIPKQIKGLQLTGIATRCEDLNKKTTYYKRFPFSVVVPGQLWNIKINTMKFTHYKLGVGKKISWTRP